MTSHPAERPDATDGEMAPSGKRPYESPRILMREPLECVAAACVPSPPGKPDPFTCANPQS